MATIAKLKSLLDEFEGLEVKKERIGKDAAVEAWLLSRKGGGTMTQEEIGEQVGRKQATVSFWCRIGEAVLSGDQRTFSEIYAEAKGPIITSNSPVQGNTKVADVLNNPGAVAQALADPNFADKVMERASSETRAIVVDEAVRDRSKPRNRVERGEASTRLMEQNEAYDRLTKPIGNALMLLKGAGSAWDKYGPMLAASEAASIRLYLTDIRAEIGVLEMYAVDETAVLS